MSEEIRQPLTNVNEKMRNRQIVERGAKSKEPAPHKVPGGLEARSVSSGRIPFPKEAL